ncbi:MAG: class I SAM-dependent methyltransferase [Deltaproteobacteria bacterium]
MTFYTDLSEVYDALFPVSSAQRSLFDGILKEGWVSRVADAGCGSGAQLLHFASAGISCVGFDPDPALVALARRKIAPFPDARIEIGGFADMARVVKPAVDLVLCLGNSLVHVAQEDAQRFLADAADALSPAGGILVQILNYERLLRGSVAELPLMRADDGAIEFRRRYEWESPRKVGFRTALRIARGDEPLVIRNDIPLYPIYPDELWEMLAAAGFSRIRYSGDFAGSEFTPESEALVCLARKS